MVEPDTIMLMILRDIREDIANLKKGLDHRFDTVETRLKTIERKVENVKQAAFGESVMGRYMVAEVEERLEDINRRLSKLEELRPS